MTLSRVTHVSNTERYAALSFQGLFEPELPFEQVKCQGQPQDEVPELSTPVSTTEFSESAAFG